MGGWVGWVEGSHLVARGGFSPRGIADLDELGRKVVQADAGEAARITVAQQGEERVKGAERQHVEADEPLADPAHLVGVDLSA